MRDERETDCNLTSSKPEIQKSMCIYSIYIHIYYICMYTYIFIHIHIYYICIYVYICIHICIYNICMCTYFYTCMHNTLGDYILYQVLEGPLFSGSFQSRGNTHKPRKIKLLHTVLMEPRQHLQPRKGDDRKSSQRSRC